MDINKIFKCGNSLVVVLPPDVLNAAGIYKGDNVSIENVRERESMSGDPIFVKDRIGHGILIKRII